MIPEPLLEVKNVSIDYGSGSGRRRVVHDASLTVHRNEIVAVVGESGAGKSTLARAVLGLVPVAAGTITLAGKEITDVKHSQRATLTSNLQAVFQDPNSSLNPTRKVGHSLTEPLVRSRMTRKEQSARVRAVLERVGLPSDCGERYPRTVSGGQRQRLAIARAMIGSPELIVCDEALSALDLSIQAQIINLLMDLRTEDGVSYLFIGHDIGVIRHIADTVVVLKGGHVVEAGTVGQVCDSPREEYTQRLLSATPVPSPSTERVRVDARAKTLSASVIGSAV